MGSAFKKALEAGGGSKGRRRGPQPTAWLERARRHADESLEKRLGALVCSVASCRALLVAGERGTALPLTTGLLSESNHDGGSSGGGGAAAGTVVVLLTSEGAGALVSGPKDPEAR